MNCWLYKSGEDTWSEISLVSARGMIDGFVRGGSAINVINGGVRIQVPGGQHWDFIHPESVEPGYQHRGVWKAEEARRAPDGGPRDGDA